MALSIMERHKKLERNITLLGICAFAAVTVGGIVEIAPLFWIDNTIEKVAVSYTHLTLPTKA